ncbi:phosphatidic acid phosphatase type 2/haloperoxidase [Naematelia encephala]|uniref:Phosphatidic acid phosphatase type 2/haloperoxidase n=1 Tax=Naematelia encephala TaxID=71784 RepID=A0A1Y2B2R4_9TREE|nr:phosphatidic acid phosphatase type 2/haloperoxidase [Naematelia encephala]
MILCPTCRDFVIAVQLSILCCYSICCFVSFPPSVYLAIQETFNMDIKLPWNKSLPTSEASRRWRIVWSYLPDWCLTIFLWGIFYLLDTIDGYRRLFSVTDTSLAHPFAHHERIPIWLLIVLCGIVPGVLIIIVGGLFRRSLWDVHSGILGLILSLGLSETFTDIIKITVGRPRPDLFDRCQLPSDLTSDPTHGLTSWTACTRTDLLNDGFRSFPSGHSSFSWCGMWFLILYMAAKMRVYNRLGYTYKSWLLLAPLSCASLVAVSRTMDYRHHATDVIAGAIIGILTGWWGYRQYYPPLSHPQSYKPYAPRIPKPAELPLHHRHSMEGTNTPFLSPEQQQQQQTRSPLPGSFDGNGNGSSGAMGNDRGLGGMGNDHGEDAETVPRDNTV